MDGCYLELNKKPNRLIEVFVEAASNEVVLFGFNTRGTPEEHQSASKVIIASSKKNIPDFSSKVNVLSTAEIG
jgi:hypothetical protein